MNNVICSLHVFSSINTPSLCLVLFWGLKKSTQTKNAQMKSKIHFIRIRTQMKDILCTANISAVKNTLFTCVLKAHVLPLYFLHQNKCKFYIRLNAIFYTGINAISTRNKCNFYTWINVFTSMYIYFDVKITFIHM